MTTVVQVVLPKEPGLERESISWFARIWPRSQRPEWPQARPLNAIQEPGDVIFMPAGAPCPYRAWLPLEYAVPCISHLCASNQAVAAGG